MITSDILAAIESKAQWLRDDACLLADFVARLPMNRDFPTKAEAAMDDAEATLIAALKIVRSARTHLLSKPKEQNHGEYRESI